MLISFSFFRSSGHSGFYLHLFKWIFYARYSLENTKSKNFSVKRLFKEFYNKYTRWDERDKAQDNNYAWIFFFFELACWIWHQSYKEICLYWNHSSYKLSLYCCCPSIQLFPVCSHLLSTSNMHSSFVCCCRKFALMLKHFWPESIHL